MKWQLYMNSVITNLDAETFIKTACMIDIANIRIVQRGHGQFCFMIEHDGVQYQTATHNILNFTQFCNLFKIYQVDNQGFSSFREYCQSLPNMENCIK